MADHRLHLQVIGTEGILIDERAEMVILTSLSGDIGILPGHMPYSVVLRAGPLHILNEGHERKVPLGGGIAEIKDNHLVILTTTTMP